MRISDWSSDVCSSDLWPPSAAPLPAGQAAFHGDAALRPARPCRGLDDVARRAHPHRRDRRTRPHLGAARRTLCRESEKLCERSRSGKASRRRALARDRARAGPWANPIYLRPPPRRHRIPRLRTRRRWGRRRMGADERRLDSSRRPIRRPRCGTVADAELSQPEDRLEHPYAGRARRRAWSRHGQRRVRGFDDERGGLWREPVDALGNRRRARFPGVRTRGRWGLRRSGADERRLDSSRRPIRRPRGGTVADAELAQPEDRLEHPYAGRARRRAWSRHGQRRVRGFDDERGGLWREPVDALGHRRRHRLGRGSGRMECSPLRPDARRAEGDRLTAMLAKLSLPLMCAPMSFASAVPLAVACCRAGVIGGWQGGPYTPSDRFEADLKALAETDGAAPVVNLPARWGRAPADRPSLAEGKG